LGKLRRHIKLASVDDIADQHVAMYVSLAWEAARRA